MNTNALAAGVIGFLLGGLVVSVAATLDEDAQEPAHEQTSTHQTIAAWS